MRLLFALPGFHRFDRGAETALLALAEACARSGDEVTVMGSGDERPAAPYRFVHIPSIRRERFERFPSFPPLRSDTNWEEASFAPGLARRYRPGDYDVTVTCSYPFTNLLLRRAGRGGSRPRHVFVTQNGDWAARNRGSEYRWFGCDGLVCTNPDYLERNRDRWRCALIPNGVDTTRFSPGPSERARFGLPEGVKLVLMVSALIPSKRVAEGVRAVAALPDTHLVVAGDGVLRDDVRELAAEILPGRYTRLSIAADDMPRLYRSADAFLHMSLVESFGNVFIEAMACGLPIVAHDTSRLRWIVGDDERLVDTEQAGTVSAALAEALAAGGSSDAGRAERFSWANVAAQYRSFFAELIA